MRKIKFLGLALIVLVGFALVFGCEGGTAGSMGPPGQDWNALKPGSANELVSKIRAGWNLGNTLDMAASYRNDPPEESADIPPTTEANILKLKEAGINAIRIPVSWSSLMPNAPGFGNNFVGDDYTIDPRWMARVKEIVDYVVKNDMYAILNTHHDTGILCGLYDDPVIWSFGPGFSFQLAVGVETSAVAMKKTWKQIAEYFKDYDNKLIFEDLNEPRMMFGKTFGGADDDENGPQEWSGGTPEQHRNLNYLHQVFVDTVRATGGNNVSRILMVPTHAASATDKAMAGLVLPTDVPANRGVNKIIVDIHAYAPYNFALNPHLGEYTNEWSVNGTGPDNGPRQIVETLNLAVKHFVSKGIPVVWGEMSVINRYIDNNDKSRGFNDAAREAWTEYFFSEAKKKQIPCFWWDNGHLFFTENDAANFGVTAGTIGATIDDNNEFNALLNRHNNTFPFPFLIRAIQRATQ
jgi:endoglucanase